MELISNVKDKLKNKYLKNNFFYDFFILCLFFLILLEL